MSSFLNRRRATRSTGLLRLLVALAVLVMTTLVAVSPASAAQVPSSGAGNTLTYPSGVTVTSTTSGPDGITAPASNNGFGSTNGFGYSAGAWSPTVPDQSPGFTASVPGSNTLCPDYGECSGLGTMTFTFSQPVLNPSMHIDELGSLQSASSCVNNVCTSTSNNTAANLTLVTPGITMAVASGTNIQIVGGNTIRTLTDTYNLSCSTVIGPPGCGTVAFTGLVTSLTFNVGSFTSLNAGTPAQMHGSDAFPVAFTIPDAPPPSNPAVSLVKSVAEVALTSAGQVLHYSFVVTNTGDVALAPVSVSETAFSGTGMEPVVSCPPEATSLAPGASVTCTASYTVTQADIEAGKVSNTAVASGTPQVGPAVFSTPSSAQLLATQTPAMTITKAAEASAVTSPAQPGQLITYSLIASNTGNVTLTKVSITDGLAGLSALTYSWPGMPGVLAPGQTVTATASYHLSQGDIDAGHVTNAATTTGTPSSGPVLTPPPASTDTPLGQVPGLRSTKTADASGITSPAQVGEKITYHFTATNTGNLSLTSVKITDGLDGLSQLSYTWPGAPGRLSPGQSVTAVASYTITQADIDAGQVTNIATTTALTPPRALLSRSASVTTPLERGLDSALAFTGGNTTLLPLGLIAGLLGGAALLASRRRKRS
ncbi:putative repeat protein (TIGR01451 family) [Psychromicrobium silvestre]|uniref:Putative repeat protein (TIGR01451 family) n=1 Tax=Psychromicrobium silvestre TaxID=1645614 RepID=A0A7Y9LVR2_9MICC|nr:DUF11 domain-containing protein [Psychromicrobium silvestre]NYE96507.1 putative repeat protein (TIGR01451 family) [Psychromicrobium silvestre]